MSSDKGFNLDFCSWYKLAPKSGLLGSIREDKRCYSWLIGTRRGVSMAMADDESPMEMALTSNLAQDNGHFPASRQCAIHTISHW